MKLVTKSKTFRQNKRLPYVRIGGDNVGMIIKNWGSYKFISAKSINYNQILQYLLKKVPKNFRGDAKVSIFSKKRNSRDRSFELSLAFVSPLVDKMNAKSTICWSVHRRETLGNNTLVTLMLMRR